MWIETSYYTHERPHTSFESESILIPMGGKFHLWGLSIYAIRRNAEMSSSFTILYHCEIYDLFVLRMEW